MKRHRGISLWRDNFEPQHWVVILFGRRYFHIYGWGRPYKQHFYWVRVPGYRQYINDSDFQEFRRVPI